MQQPPRTLNRAALIAVAISIVGILVYLVLWWLEVPDAYAPLPLWIALALGGSPLLLVLLKKMLRGEFSSDLLAGISIITALILEEYLAGTIVVLMLSGGALLEQYAVAQASSVLTALARRMPSVAHRKEGASLIDIPLDAVQVGDLLIVLPREICPVDGVVVEGHGYMDEAFLTGEPFQIAKTPGAPVISGAQNLDYALTIRATRLVQDSRYARIMSAMEETRHQRVPLRRLGDQLGAWYTPLALLIAAGAWMVSGEPSRFLAVLVTATPCPLLIGIPVAIIGAISLAARRGIIVRDPAILEAIETCNVVILDKTGTLTSGKPELESIVLNRGIERSAVLALIASLEQYSRHPLASAVVQAARKENVNLSIASEVHEPPGQGLRGIVQEKHIEILGRSKVVTEFPAHWETRAREGVLECFVKIDGTLAAQLIFRDPPRHGTRDFISHLRKKHGVVRTLLVSGDRESEVQHLARKVGIDEVYSNQSPEEKVAIVTRESINAHTLFVGDGINDAPALQAAHVGIAFGSQHEVTVEAAGAVLLEPSLEKLDEVLHISRSMRGVALQSAVGGMAASIAGMCLAAVGLMTPVWGALYQELIDLVAVLNALRAGRHPRVLRDYQPEVSSES